MSGKIEPQKAKTLETQQGFTLIELAIVLVIIGLLIGGVLKGKDLIDSTKVTKLMTEMDSYTSAFQTYKERFRVNPLSDTQQRFANYTTTGTTHGWARLRAAGLLPLAPGQANPTTHSPTNVFDGTAEVYATTALTLAPATGQLVLCLNNIPGKAAAALDAKLDDGAGDTGSVRVASGSNTGGTPTATFAEGTNIMCTLM